MGVYRSSPTGAFVYLRSINICTRMPKVCKLAHPDPMDYYHDKANLMVSHSNQVTAVVALANAGLSIDAIAFRLRWLPRSVQHYLRECSSGIGKLTLDAVTGASLI